MRAKFVRHTDNPLDSLDIGRTIERRLEKKSKEIKEFFIRSFPNNKISEHDTLTAGVDTGETNVVGWKITITRWVFYIKYVEMEDNINDFCWFSGYYKIKDNMIIDEVDYLTLKEAEDKLFYWIYKVTNLYNFK